MCVLNCELPAHPWASSQGLHCYVWLPAHHQPDRSYCSDKAREKNTPQVCADAVIPSFSWEGEMLPGLRSSEGEGGRHQESGYSVSQLGLSRGRVRTASSILSWGKRPMASCTMYMSRCRGKSTVRDILFASLTTA